jgi:hypothetical protein
MGGAACNNDETTSNNDEVGDGDGDRDEPPCACTEAEEEDWLTWPCQCKYEGANPQTDPPFWGRPVATGKPPANTVGYICADEYADAYTDCANICTYETANGYDFRILGEASVPCDENHASMSCSAWQPSREIDYNTGTDTYEVSSAFFASIMADPEPLWACDDAVFVPRSSGGGFEVANASSGELLYELGLRNGDELLSLNGLPLTNYYDVGIAYATLIWTATEFTLEIERNSSTLELEYEILISQP